MSTYEEDIYILSEEDLEAMRASSMNQKRKHDIDSEILQERLHKKEQENIVYRLFQNNARARKRMCQKILDKIENDTQEEFKRRQFFNENMKNDMKIANDFNANVDFSEIKNVMGNYQ